MLQDLKNMYNFNIERYNKGIKFFETASQEDIDKYLPEFIKIHKTLEALLEKILEYQEVTSEEIWNGFK